MNALNPPYAATPKLDSIDQPGVNHGLAYGGLGLVPDGDHRQPHRLGTLAEHGQRVLGRCRIGLDEQGRMQRHQLVLQLQRRLVIAPQARALELGAQPRRHVRGHRDAAVPAMRHEAERGRILAGELIEAFPHGVALLRDAHHIGGGILHAGDVLELEQPLHGLDRHVDHRARRNVVDDDGDSDGVVDRLEVLVEPFLGRLVVVRGDDQHGGGTGLFGMLRQFDRLAGRVRPGARNHRHAAFGLLDAPLHHLPVLLVRERRALAGGAHRNQPIGALGDLPIDQVAERLLVQRAVAEGSDERGERALEARLDGHDRVL